MLKVMTANSLSLKLTSDHLFRALIDNSSEGVVLMNEKAELTYISQTAKKIFEYPNQKLSKIKSFDYIHQEDKNKVKETFLYLLRHPGKKVTVQYRVRHSEGYYKWIESSAINLLHDNAIQAIVNTFRDITEKKQREERQQLLAQISSQLTKPINEEVTLQEVSNLLVPDFADYCRIALIDEQNNVQNIAVSHANPKKVGIAKQLYYEYINRPENTHGIRRIIESGNEESLLRIDEKLLKKMHTNSKVMEIVTKIGLKSYIGLPLKTNGKTIGAVTFSSTREDRIYTPSDIEFFKEIARRIALFLTNLELYRKMQREVSFRKKVEKDLKKSEKRFRAIIENSSDAFRLTNKFGEIIYASSSTKKLLGYSLKEYTSRTVFELLHPDDREKYLAVFNYALLHPRKPVSLTYRIRHKNGSWKWMEGVGVNMLDDPDVAAVVSNFRDVTDKKQLEMQKDEFLSIASHELKTPATSLKAFAQVVQKRLEQKKETESALLVKKMNSQIDKLINLISDLLDITRLEAKKMKFNFTRFNIGEVIKETVQEVQLTSTQHTIIIKNNIRALIYADKERIEQVLVNLLTNAIKYSPNADKVVVKVKNNKDNVSISVQDFGIGIQKEQQKNLFDRYYRGEDDVQRKFPGLGLGLYISAEIVKNHKGKIHVDSEVNKSTTFTLVLPKSINHQIKGTK
jgi:PAS domain S-box-containing protein